MSQIVSPLSPTATASPTILALSIGGEATASAGANSSAQAVDSDASIGPKIAAGIGLAATAVCLALISFVLVCYMSRSRRKQLRQGTVPEAGRASPMRVRAPYELTPDCTPDPNKGYFAMPHGFGISPNRYSASDSPGSSPHSSPSSSSPFLAVELDTSPGPPVPAKPSWMKRNQSVATQPRTPWM